jgi:hypothetical protein
VNFVPAREPARHTARAGELLDLLRVLAVTPRAFAGRLMEVHTMGRGILLWLLGIPLPIIILLVLFMR